MLTGGKAASSKRKTYVDGDKVTSTVVTTKEKMTEAASDNGGKWKVYMADTPVGKDNNCVLSTAD